MPGENLPERANTVFDRLSGQYPPARTSLRFTTPLDVLIATILSAQCTDVRVNQVTKDLFQRFRTARDYANAEIGELEEVIRSTGFFHNKARAIKACCREILECHGGDVPGTMEELTRLTGVGRKTANVILGNVFGVPGIVVDTHVRRLARLLGLSVNKDPARIEFDLMALLSKERWTAFSHLLIHHGRIVCRARRPRCPTCCLADLCPSAQG